MLKSIAAYFASAIAGAAVFVTFHRTDGHEALGLLADIGVFAILISVLILPFWVATIFIANAVHTASIIYYIFSALIIGVALLPLLVGAGPQMAFDSSPDLDYMGRVLRNLQKNGLTFSIMSVLAGIIYWFLAISNRRPLSREKQSVSERH